MCKSFSIQFCTCLEVILWNLFSLCQVMYIALDTCLTADNFSKLFEVRLVPWRWPFWLIEAGLFTCHMCLFSQCRHWVASCVVKTFRACSGVCTLSWCCFMQKLQDVWCTVILSQDVRGIFLTDVLYQLQIDTQSCVDFVNTTKWWEWISN